MNSTVNLHGLMAATQALRDSLIPAAAYKAIEKAKPAIRWFTAGWWTIFTADLNRTICQRG
jgi:hypothetical protein